MRRSSEKKCGGQLVCFPSLRLYCRRLSPVPCREEPGLPVSRRKRSGAASGPKQPPLGLASLALLAALLALPGAADGQIPTVQDARLPRSGEFWFELTPSLSFWSSQFALDSELAADGTKEPLTTDFGGPLTDRLYPNALPFLADINSDADVLGYDPLTPDDLSFGSLDYREISNRAVVLPLGLEIGILERLSLDVMVPLVQTRSESFFGYDTTSATVTAGMSAVPDPVAFFGGIEAAETQLAELIDGGTLTPEETAQALALLANTTTYSDALERRVMENLFLPVGSTTAGMQMLAAYDALATGYTTFGLALPAFELPAGATASDLAALFASAELDGAPPGTVRRGFSVGELAVGLRFGLIDTFTPITAFEEPTPAPLEPEEGAEGAQGVPPDAEEGEGAEPRRPVEHSEAVLRLARRPPTVQFRTTIGGKYRFPLGDVNGAPYLDPSNFLDIPIGDGTTDIEISLFQDIRVGPRFLFLASGYFGLQMEDEVELRVNPPDQPFGLASTLGTLQRKLGNYIAARVAPQFSINNALAIGAEYSFWNKGSDEYQLLAGSEPTAEPLELETSQTRHMLGFGVFYRTQDLWEVGRTSLPVEISLIYQTSIAGSGGQTPAGDRVTVYLRLPFKVF
jgi:hypothetical protein